MRGRDRAHVEPTPIGTRLIERARLLLNQARDLEQDMTQMLGLEIGLLRIGAGPYPAELSVARAVGRVVRAFDPCIACAIHTLDVEGQENARGKAL